MVNKNYLFQTIVSVQNIFILKPLFVKYSVIDFILFIFEEIFIRFFKGKIIVCLFKDKILLVMRIYICYLFFMISG